MSSTPSPLRYPGGKTKLYPYVKNLLIANNLIGETYIEPFAGGSGLALKLLLSNDVKRIVINDLDFAIYSFWFSVLNHSDELCQFVRDIELTIDQWENQKYIYNNQQEFDVLDIGKATLFLNRTNISGVLKGGVIGGLAQNGKYSIDARFNRETLINKIEAIARVSNKIDLYNLDAVDFMKVDTLGRYYKVFINFDPPYFEKGSQLYKNSFTPNDHEDLKNAIKKCSRKWIVTYDICELTSKLYSKFRSSYISIDYSVKSVRNAKESVFFSDNLIIPKGIQLNE